jgi:hypothetical protein
MRFQTMTEDEIQAMNLLDNGKYPFEVFKATDKISKAGAEMIELQLHIYDHNNKAHLLFDYLLEAMPHKILHFTSATGLQFKYQSGTLTASDCMGKKGFVDVFIQKSKDPAYKDKNSVKDYIMPDLIKTEGPGAEFFDDKCPF